MICQKEEFIYIILVYKYTNTRHISSRFLACILRILQTYIYLYRNRNVMPLSVGARLTIIIINIIYNIYTTYSKYVILCVRRRRDRYELLSTTFKFSCMAPLYLSVCGAMLYYDNIQYGMCELALDRHRYQ